MATEEEIRASPGVSASNAEDFQPPTGNPQNNVNSNLQKNSGGLQPAPGQGGVSQDNLLRSGNLKVVTISGSSGSVTPPSVQQAQSFSPSWLSLFLVIAVFVIFRVLKRILMPTSSAGVLSSEAIAEPQVEVSAETEVTPSPVTKTTTKKAKTKPKKRSAKKRKKSRR